MNRGSQRRIAKAVQGRKLWKAQVASALHARGSRRLKAVLRAQFSQGASGHFAQCQPIENSSYDLG